MPTVIPLGDPKARKIYSGHLAVDVAKSSYFTSTMMGSGEETQMPIQRLDYLENEAGEQITYDLSLQLTGEPTEGDDDLEGNVERLKFATDKMYIDQLRKGADGGGRMTQKRTLHSLRKVARARLTEYFARLYDEIITMYASGARGINADFIYGLAFTGRANNPLKAPDSTHQMYGGSATSKATITSSDKMGIAVLEKLPVRAKLMGGGTQNIPRIQPILVEGMKTFVLVLSPYQIHSLRTETGASGWLEIQKSLATSIGKNSPIIKGGVGMHNQIVIHEHESTIRFNDYGSGANLAAARGLFLGRQAVCMAFGSSGNRMAFDWNEELKDHKNRPEFSASTIFGTKKCSFSIAGTEYDFGSIAVDTYIDTSVA